MEEHFATPLFLDGPGQDLKNAALKFEGRGTKLIEPLCDIGDKRIAAMDAAGIDMQVLSLTSPGYRAARRCRGNGAGARKQ